MMYTLPQNPFTRPAFWGRENEIRGIYKRLLSTPPQSCAIIGETSFGKTTLLRTLPDALNFSSIKEMNDDAQFMFVYLDCITYMGLGKLGNQASFRFWWNLYIAVRLKLQPAMQAQAPVVSIDSDETSLDERAFELKSLIEDVIQQQPQPVIFLFDNFEGIAHLPPRDSMWLRSLAQYSCAYVVTSRHLLYLLYQYHSESWATPSPFWNLFAEPIYLGLMEQNEVDNFLKQASGLAEQADSFWASTDTDLIRRVAGCHPELIRIACVRLFEQRLSINYRLKMDEKDFLEITYQNMKPICQLLWQGLADAELWDTQATATHKPEEVVPFSPYQIALIDLAHERDVVDQKLLYMLVRRGLIDHSRDIWHIFSEGMRWYILEQEMGSVTANAKRGDFTPLEAKIYAYLNVHKGNVCGREEIKQAVWEQGSQLPGDSALQKIIERIRKKIEPDPDNPHYLISVRGRGYMLREDFSGLL